MSRHIRCRDQSEPIEVSARVSFIVRQRAKKYGISRGLALDEMLTLELDAAGAPR